jgi:hypothetical protein
VERLAIIEGGKQMGSATESLSSFPAFVDATGNPVQRIGPNYAFAFGDVLDFYFDSGGGGGWAEQEQEIKPTDPWSIAGVSLIGWELRFHGESGGDIEDHEVHHMGVLPWITVQDPVKSVLRVKCRALLRDAKTDKRWNGMARVHVSFYRQI